MLWNWQLFGYDWQTNQRYRLSGLSELRAGKKDAALIGGTMCGQTPEELAAEFGIARQLRPNLKVAVFHATLSVDSTEKLEDSEENDQRWLAIAANYMKAMEFDNNQYAVVKHSDTEHDHIHIVATRICLDGSVVDDSWDYYKSQETIRQLERNYNLETVTPSWETDKRAQTTGEHRQLQSKGNKSVRVQLQDLIDEVAQDNPSMPEFVERLQQQGVEVQVGLTRTGFSKGISYNLEGVALSGTQLGKAYTFCGLQKHRGVILSIVGDNFVSATFPHYYGGMMKPPIVKLNSPAISSDGAIFVAGRDIRYYVFDGDSLGH